MGERHFDTILNRLERKFGVHAELVRPRVAYRETIKGKAEGQGKHKKQSGGRGPVRRLLDPDRSACRAGRATSSWTRSWAG